MADDVELTSTTVGERATEANPSGDVIQGSQAAGALRWSEWAITLSELGIRRPRKSCPPDGGVLPVETLALPSATSHRSYEAAQAPP
jgi:hypothetical protein